MKIPFSFLESEGVEIFNEDEMESRFCDFLDDTYESLFGISPSSILGDMDPIQFNEELANYRDAFYHEIEDEDGDLYYVQHGEDLSDIRKYEVRFVSDWIPADPEPDGECGHENNGYWEDHYSRDLDASIVEIFPPDSVFVTLGDVLEVWSPGYKIMRGYVIGEGIKWSYY
jgi:hypothetical protein